MRNLETDILVINGDLHDLYLGPPRLDLHDSFDKNPNIKEVVYIRGNHDYNIKDFLDPVQQDKIKDSFEIADILITHGNTYDYFYKGEEPSSEGIGKSITVLRQWLEEILHINFRLLMKKISFGLVDKLLFKTQEKAVAENPGKKVIIGHTHAPLCKHPYYNSGCMVDDHFTYLVIDIEDGLSTVHLVGN